MKLAKSGDPLADHRDPLPDESEDVKSRSRDRYYTERTKIEIGNDVLVYEVCEIFTPFRTANETILQMSFLVTTQSGL